VFIEFENDFEIELRKVEKSIDIWNWICYNYFYWKWGWKM